MTMQRRHYELIAEILASLSHHEFGSNERKMLAEHFCRELRATNPNFNPSRFLKACGVEEDQ